jgi:hypothetical protein
LSVAGFCLPGAAGALTRPELYQASVPVPDRSEASKPAAFQAALRIVLTRVTGRRTAEDDPAFAPLVGNARRYVQQYRETQDGQLWVSFDAAAIDRWLGQNDQPLWGRERPSTFIWLTAPTAAPGGTVITAESGVDIKSAIDAAAYQRGAPVAWPSTADLQRNHLDYTTLGSASPGALADIAHRAGSEGTLIGRASGTGEGATVRWTYLFRDRSSEFSGPAVEGINRAADTYASMFAVSGAAAPVVIEVAGIGDLKDYAFVENYLESLAFISHVGVEELSGDVSRFLLTTRGGGGTLQNSLALSGRLQSGGATENGVPRFQLRH